MVKQRQTLQGMAVAESLRGVLDAVIDDSCAYIRSLLDVYFDCNNIEEVELLIEKLQFADAIIHFNDVMKLLEVKHNVNWAI